MTGSVAMGLADDASDVELNLWADVLPSVEERREWIAEIGGANAQISTQPWSDGALNATFRIGDVWVEAGWMTKAATEETLRAIVAAEVLGHSRLQLACVIEHAVPLRSNGWVEAQKQAVGTYPEALIPRMIDVNTAVLELPHAMRGRWTYCRRFQPLALTERLTWETYNVLRILFAINRRWEPDFKWLRHVTRILAIAPSRLAERIEEVFAGAVLERRVLTSMRLIQETLEMIPRELVTPRIERARQVIAECLEMAPEGLEPNHEGRPEGETGRR